MNRSSSWALQQALKAKAAKKAAQTQNAENTLAKTAQSSVSYKSLEARQGRADAEMLLEKK